MDKSNKLIGLSKLNLKHSSSPVPAARRARGAKHNGQPHGPWSARRHARPQPQPGRAGGAGRLGRHAGLTGPAQPAGAQHGGDGDVPAGLLVPRPAAPPGSPAAAAAGEPPRPGSRQPAPLAGGPEWGVRGGIQRAQPRPQPGLPCAEPGSSLGRSGGRWYRGGECGPRRAPRRSRALRPPLRRAGRLSPSLLKRRPPTEALTWPGRPGWAAATPGGQMGSASASRRDERACRGRHWPYIIGSPWRRRDVVLRLLLRCGTAGRSTSSRQVSGCTSPPNHHQLDRCHVCGQCLWTVLQVARHGPALQGPLVGEWHEGLLSVRRTSQWSTNHYAEP